MLLLLLESVHLSSDDDKRIWSLESLDALIFVSPFFQFSTKVPSRDSLLLNKPIWKSKSPRKVKSFVWVAALDKCDANDMLQKHRPLNAFFLFSVVLLQYYLWNKLFRDF